MTGTMQVRTLAGIVREAIDAVAIARHLEDPSCGGRVVFEGVVRDHHDGRSVRFLEYEAYEAMATAQLSAIASQMAARWPVGRVAIVHRIGHLDIGDTAVVVGVACPHRAEAFEACRFGIDAVKRDVPVWKYEHFADGTAAWPDACC